MEVNDLVSFFMGLVKKERFGNYVFFLRLGRLSKRRVKNKTAKEKKKWNLKHPPTPGQEEARTKFSTNRQLAAHMSNQLHEFGVWRRAVETFKPKHMNADNYLLHRNHGCMEGGKFKKMGPLVVSLGTLLLPDELTATRQGDTVTLHWMPEAPENDLLHVAIVYDDERDSLLIIKTGYACRGDGTFAFRVRKNCHTVHVYPFFGRESGEDFTPNGYFRVERKTKS